MNAQDFLTFAHDSWIGQFVREVSWMFAACEIVHFIGLCLVLGPMFLVDLRLIGVLKASPVEGALKFSHLAALGLGLNTITGLAFFASNPTNYWNNPLFAAKMSLVAVALLNVLWFEAWERKRVIALEGGVVTTTAGKLIGGLSLSVWIGIVILGRFLPVLGTG